MAPAQWDSDSRNRRLCSLFTFNLYLSGFKRSDVKTSKQNLRIVIQLPFICRNSRMYCKMTQNITYQKILNIIHGVAKNVSLDLVYVPAHKPNLILIVHREIIVLKLLEM